MIEIEDFLTPEEVDSIENLFTSVIPPWYYLEKISGPYDPINNINDPNIKDAVGFVHSVIYKSEIESDHAKAVALIVDALEKKINLKINKIIRARVIMTPKDPSFGPDNYHLPHVDHFFPHQTILYYINDSTGDTFFFEEMYKEINQDKKTLVKRIAPKRGKCIIFDGLQYHTGSAPTDNNRLTISINFT
jgi:hypothetical protein